MGIIALASLLLTLFQPPLTLEWKWKRGEIFHYHFYEESKVFETQPAMPIKGEMRLDFDWRFEVKDVSPDGNATVAVRFESVAVKMNCPNEEGGIGEYNSIGKKPASQKILKPYEFLLHKEFMVSLDKRGRILKLENADALMKQYEKESGSPLTYLTVQMWRGEFHEVLRNQLDNALPILSEKAVRSEESWISDHRLSHYLFLLKKESRSVFKSTQAKKEIPCAKIQTVSKWKIEKQPPHETVESFKVDKSTEETWFATELGCLVEQNSELVMDLVDLISVQEGGSGSPRQQKISYHVELKSKMQLVRKEAR